MKIQLFASGVACLTALMPTIGMAQSFSRAVDMAPYGAPPPYAEAPPPFADTPPPALPPSEIMASVRSAGFDPLSRPMHRGGVYVVFAADRHDVEVRVTVDAYSGRVLAATRLAGMPYEPGYGGYRAMSRQMPPAMPPDYGFPDERAPRFYDRAPMPPADVPIYGPGRFYRQPPIEEGESRLLERGRGFEEPPRHAATAPAAHPPLPRTRRTDIATGTVKKDAAPQSQSVPQAQAAPPVQSAPQPAPPASSGDVPAAPAPQQPSMVPIAPLE
jgi:hypothetical protein